jgi:hypothetical protein
LPTHAKLGTFHQQKPKNHELYLAVLTLPIVASSFQLMMIHRAQSATPRKIASGSINTQQELQLELGHVVL